MENNTPLEEFLESLGVCYREMPEKASELVRHFEKIAIEKNIKSEWTSLIGQRLTFQKSELSIAYPTSKGFTKRFLKFYLNLVDEDRQPLNEELFDYYSDMLYSESDERKRICYKSYRITNDPIQDITLGLLDNMDNVGLTTWEAGFFLAEFISSNEPLFRNKNILELGSGIGLTSICLCKDTNPKKVIVTDYTTEIIENIKQNFRINKISIKEDDGNEENTSNNQVEIMELDWEKEFNPIFQDTDIILVADCVYDNDLTSALVSVLNRLLSQPSPRTNALPVAFVASTIRNKSTFDFYLKQLSQSNITHQFVNDYSNVSTNLSSFMETYNEQLDVENRINAISKVMFNYCRDSIALSLLSKK